MTEIGGTQKWADNESAPQSKSYKAKFQGGYNVDQNYPQPIRLQEQSLRGYCCSRGTGHAASVPGKTKEPSMKEWIGESWSPSQVTEV